MYQPMFTPQMAAPQGRSYTTVSVQNMGPFPVTIDAVSPGRQPARLAFARPGQIMGVQAYLGDLVRAIDGHGTVLAQVTAGQGALLVQAHGGVFQQQPRAVSTPMLPQQSGQGLAMKTQALQSISTQLYKNLFEVHGQVVTGRSLIRSLEGTTTTTVLEIRDLVKAIKVGLNLEEQLLKDRSFQQTLLLAADSVKDALSLLERFNVKVSFCGCCTYTEEHPYLDSQRVRDLCGEVRSLSAGLLGFNIDSMQVNLGGMHGQVNLSGTSTTNYDNTSVVAMDRGTHLDDEARSPLLQSATAQYGAVSAVITVDSSGSAEASVPPPY